MTIQWRWVWRVQACAFLPPAAQGKSPSQESGPYLQHGSATNGFSSARCRDRNNLSVCENREKVDDWGLACTQASLARPGLGGKARLGDMITGRSKRGREHRVVRPSPGHGVTNRYLQREREGAQGCREGPPWGTHSAAGPVPIWQREALGSTGHARSLEQRPFRT